MRYICDQCVSEDFSIIPAFILKFWNFKKFSISKKARELILNWYIKPIIHIKSADPILKKSHALQISIILKRKIHKIFDLMKCEKRDEFVIEVLGEHKYLVLKENLISLKDLFDIEEQVFIGKLQNYLYKFENHILNECETCKYTGGNCMGCLSSEVLMAYNVESVFYCNICLLIYHKDCANVHPCKID